MRLARAMRLCIAAQREQSPADPEYGASTRPILSKIAPHQPCSYACESADLAYFTSVCDAPQLYTDAAPVLYASRRVAVTAQSGILDVHVHCVVERILSPRR